MHRLLETRAIQVVVRFGEGIFGDDVRRQCHPCPAKVHDTTLAVMAGVWAQFGTELVDLFSDNRLKIGDLGSAEERGNGLSTGAVEIMVHGTEAIAGVAETSRVVGVLVPPSGATRVQDIEVLGVIDVELCGCYADDGTWLNKVSHALGGVGASPDFRDGGLVSSEGDQHDRN